MILQGMWNTGNARNDVFQNGVSFVTKLIRKNSRYSNTLCKIQFHQCGNPILVDQDDIYKRRFFSSSLNLAQTETTKLQTVDGSHDDGMVSWLEGLNHKGNDKDSVGSSHYRYNDAYALRQVYETIQNVWNDHKLSSSLSSNMTTAPVSLMDLDVHSLPKGEMREAVGVARRLQMRLNSMCKNNDCPRCWLQRTHCICSDCPTIDQPPQDQNNNPQQEHPSILPKVNRLFVLVHHKEIGLTVDTAKLLYMAFPNTQCHIVVNGIGPKYQPSMAKLLEYFHHDNTTLDKELKDSRQNSCFILFPAPGAQTFSQLTAVSNDNNSPSSQSKGTLPSKKWDVIVIDGTWSQANKIFSRYIPEHVPRVRLSDQAVHLLSNTNDNQGHQLRRHVIPWRQVSTLEATRLLFRDMHTELSNATTDTPWDILETYHSIANNAAKKQLGPPRIQ